MLKNKFLFFTIISLFITALFFLKLVKNKFFKTKEGQFSNLSIPTKTNYLPTEDKNEALQSITLIFVGDINLGREVNWQIIKKGNPTFPFLKTTEILKNADLTIGNLEGPLIKNCPTTRTGMIFCGQEKSAEGLLFAGFDLLNIANNHIDNFGRPGLEETKEILENNQINYFGKDFVRTKEIKNIKISFFGFDDTLEFLNLDQIADKIRVEKKESDLVIVNFHWGKEYENQPNKRQKQLAYLAIDSGADLIIGHHPHVIQPIEFYKNKPILYSLGNFVFDQMWSEETRIGLIAKIKIENNISNKNFKTDIELIPIKIYHYCQPEIITEPEKSKILEKLIPNQRN